MRSISFVEKENNIKRKSFSNFFLQFRNYLEYNLYESNNFLKINNYIFKKSLSSSNSHIFMIDNDTFIKELDIEYNKKLILRLSKIEFLIININNKLIYSGRKSQFTNNIQSYDYKQRVDEEIFIQIFTFKNNLSPDFFCYNYDLNKKFSLIMIMEYIEPQYFLNNIFLIDKNEIIFNPPNGYDFATIKKLFFESITKLHKLNIIHNDLIFINSFKYCIRNSYIDTNTNNVKFIDFGLSYIIDNEDVHSDEAKKFEIEYIEAFFNQIYDYCIKVS